MTASYNDASIRKMYFILMSKSEKEMKLIIAGGRDYQLTKSDLEHLDQIDEVKEVVTGGAKDADQGGEAWAHSRGIPIKRFPPEWNKYARGARIVRNREMVAYADAAVVFTGGRGTDPLFSLATKAGLIVYDWRNK